MKIYSIKRVFRNDIAIFRSYGKSAKAAVKMAMLAHGKGRFETVTRLAANVYKADGYLWEVVE